MKTILLIFVGGGLGSVARYLLGTWISKFYQHSFPLGTLIVNLIACLLVGVLAGVVDQRTEAKGFLIIGFCGGFSTFSTFTAESAQLFSSNLTGLAILYLSLSVLGCIAATFCGLWIAGRA